MSSSSTATTNSINEGNTLPFTSSIIDQVRLNLIHYNLWNQVIIKDDYLIGKPKEKLINTDDEIKIEFIIPRLIKDSKLSVQEINSWFNKISQNNENNKRPDRLIIGIINDDGTVVYYFIHDSIVKPRQN